MSTAAVAGESVEPRNVSLVVTNAGGYFLSGKPVALVDLRANLRALKSSEESINLHITAGSKVRYKYIKRAVQIAQEEGLAKIGLLTGPPATSGSSASASSATAR